MEAGLATASVILFVNVADVQSWRRPPPRHLMLDVPDSGMSFRQMNVSP
jgi:hypothetical protein